MPIHHTLHKASHVPCLMSFERFEFYWKWIKESSTDCEQTNSKTHSTFNIFNVQYLTILPVFSLCVWYVSIQKADGWWHQIQMTQDKIEKWFKSRVLFHSFFPIWVCLPNPLQWIFIIFDGEKWVKKGKFESFNFHAFHFHSCSSTILCVFGECECMLKAMSFMLSSVSMFVSVLENQFNFEYDLPLKHKWVPKSVIATGKARKCAGYKMYLL